MNHFTLPDDQVHIAFSGGRTSAYMLWQMVEENGGLPADRCHVIFTNTGRERAETLDFVWKLGDHLQVPITWLEYRYDNAPRAIQVGRKDANLTGKPFEDLLRRKRRLPNQAERFCTEELKVRTARRWLVMQGWRKWVKATGIRADEPRRLPVKPQPREAGWTPLADAGVTKADVAEFWKAAPFDLQLPLFQGRTIGGNCRMCFMKSEADVAAEVRENPQDTWADQMEQKYSGTFSKRYSIAQLRTFIEKQGDWVFETEGALCQASDGECT